MHLLPSLLLLLPAALVPVLGRMSHQPRTPVHLEPRSLGSYSGTLPAHPQFAYDLRQKGGLPPNPATVQKQGYNMFALCFWNTNGLHFNAATWTAQSQTKQKSILASYHKYGIKLLVSAFGDAETPTTSGKNPTTVATDLAAWVQKNNVDGVDIDYEDFDACWKQTCAKWLITFQTTLRQKLGTKYIITHAPIAPWFATSSQFAGGYLAVHKAVGSSIDLYLVQFYNQGKDYNDCAQLITGGGSAEAQYTNTALFEIIASGVPKQKLLLGKPASTADAGSGFTPLSTLAECVKEAKAKGWDTGMMVWVWNHAKSENFLKTVWG